MLKPCPFCGDASPVLEEFEVRKGYEASVHCDTCLAAITTITYDTQAEATAEAVRKWNTRVPKETDKCGSDEINVESFDESEASASVFLL